MKKVFILITLVTIMCFIPLKTHAFKSNKKSNIEKFDIDWLSFACYGGQLKEGKIRPSIIHFNNRQGVSLSNKDYILNVFFTEKVSLAPSLLGRQNIILPLSDNAYANLYLYDEFLFESPEKRYIRFDMCVFYETADYKEYVLISSDCENRLELCTDLKGRLTHINIVVSLKKGGLQTYMKGCKELEEQLKSS